MVEVNGDESGLRTSSLCVGSEQSEDVTDRVLRLFDCTPLRQQDNCVVLGESQRGLGMAVRRGCDCKARKGKLLLIEGGCG